MKLPPVSMALLGMFSLALGQEGAPPTGSPPVQEPATKWDVELPPPLAPVVQADPAPEPAPIRFEVLSSRTKEVFVSESPEMSDLPRVEGTIKVTVQQVKDPGLADSPAPLPALPPDDPAVLAGLKELRETYRGTNLIFLSCSVHMEKEGAEEARTLLRIYPNGNVDEEVVAWSNLNFLHLSGPGGYRVNFADGTFEDIGLLMGIGPIYGETFRRFAAKEGREYVEPEIPELPDLAEAGPSFVAIKGYLDSPAMDTLEQLHDLFRTSGEILRNQYLAREKAREERKAYLLANPPKPQDLKMQFWKRNRPTPAALQQFQGGQR